MIQELKSLFIYPQIISNETGEVIENIPEYFGQIYLEASIEYGPNSRYVQNLFDFIVKLENFPEISVEYSENLSGEELNSLRNFLIDLVTVEISTTTKLISNTDPKFSYECLSSILVPSPEDNKFLSIIAIKYGDYLYLSFILRNYKMDDNFLHDLESELIDTQDRRSIEFPYILNGIFPSYSQITTIWSPREI